LTKENNNEDENEQGGTVMTTSGIGLGISTSYKIAKAMGGDLNIVSQVKIPN
jgi:signal transduction histidine kinase